MAGAPDRVEIYTQRLQNTDQSLRKAEARLDLFDEKLASLNRLRAARLVKRQRLATLVQQLRERRQAIRSKLRDALES